MAMQSFEEGEPADVWPASGQMLTRLRHLEMLTSLDKPLDPLENMSKSEM